MPKVKLAQPKYPPINWLTAAILERKRVMKLEWNDLADKAGMTGDQLRYLLNSKPPEEWPCDVRNKVLRVLGLSVKLVIEEAKEVGL